VAGDALEPGQAQHLVDTTVADPVGAGDDAQVVTGPSAGMDRAGVEQHADLGHGRRAVGVAAAVHRDGARRGAVEPDDHPHRGRLAGAVRPEEPRHRARPHREGHAVDDGLRAVALAESGRFDHGDDATEAGTVRHHQFVFFA
jgi:hypothetical protein